MREYEKYLQKGVLLEACLVTFIVVVLQLQFAPLWWLAVVMVSALTLAKLMAGLGGTIVPRRCAMAKLRNSTGQSLKAWEDFIRDFEDSYHDLWRGRPLILFSLVCTVAELALTALLFKPIFYVLAIAVALSAIGVARIYSYMKANIVSVGAALFLIEVKKAFGGK